MSDDLRAWLPAIQFVMTTVVGIYAFVADRHRAHRDQLDALRADHERRSAALERDVGRLEERVRHVPTAEAVAQLTADLRELKGDLRGVSERLQGLWVRLDRHEEFLQTRMMVQ